MRKSKALALAICFSMFACMALGSGSSDSGTTIDKEISEADSVDKVSVDLGDGTSDSTKSETSTGEGTSSESGAVGVSEAVTVEEQVLYDEKNIKITATGLEDGWFGTNLKLLIENNSDQSITVQARNANVNGFMVDTMMSADVAAGKKANDELTFETTGLKDSGIDSIAVMEFYFHIFDADTWDEITDSEVITVKTSIADSYVQKVDDSGTVLVDYNGVRIIGKGLSENDSFWGPGVILYIENNSDKTVEIQVRDVSVNGFMVESMMSETVVSGKKAMSAVQFFSSDLEENSITEINDVELYFHIFDEKTWDTIFDSDVISIKF